MTVPGQPQHTLLAISKKRALFLVLCFGLWSLVVTARLAQIMVFDREQYLLEMGRSSWDRGILPAVRGRILDIDGRPLAWSSRHFVCEWQIPGSAELFQKQWKTLTATVSFLPGNWSPETLFARAGHSVVLHNNLNTHEFEQLVTLAEHWPNLRLTSRFERHRNPHPAIRRRLGEVRTVNGMEIGVSGYELAHDSLLRGRPGMYRVMLNPQGRWVAETWEKVRDVQPGYDVYVPIRVPPAEK